MCVRYQERIEPAQDGARLLMLSRPPASTSPTTTDPLADLSPVERPWRAVTSPGRCGVHTT
jgi:hypothetical protein